MWPLVIRRGVQYKVYMARKDRERCVVSSHSFIHYNFSLKLWLAFDHGIVVPRARKRRRSLFEQETDGMLAWFTVCLECFSLKGGLFRLDKSGWE